MPARCKNREGLVLERRSSGRSGLSTDVKGMGKEFGGGFVPRTLGMATGIIILRGVVWSVFSPMIPTHTCSRVAANLHHHHLHHNSGGEGGQNK